MSSTKNSTTASPQTYQRSFDALIAPLIRAASRAPAFRDRLDAAGLGPTDLDTVAALTRLPILTKDDLLALQEASPPFGGMLADGVRPRRVFQSPGPLYEPDTGAVDPWRFQPALAAAGIGQGDRVLIAFGYHLSPAGAMIESACMAAAATVVPGGVGSKDLQVAACRDLAVTAYVGPPSYLKALLERAEQLDIGLRIDKALVSAEPLLPTLRRWLTRRVGVVRQAYGTAECGHLGFECEAETGLHVPDDVLVQVCDLATGEATHDDRVGQVVATTFSHDYPIVRFGTGDLSSWLLDPCPCGRSAPRISGWEGRVGDAVKVRGMFLHPSQVAHVMERLPDVETYRIVVDRDEHRDIVSCEVVATRGPDNSPGAGLADRVRDAIRDGLRFKVDVTLVDHLPDDAAMFDDRRTWP